MLFVLFVVVVVSAWSNAVNFTDGLDGLAGGSMAMVSAAYVLITFWQYRNACATAPGLGCYNVRDPLDLALIAAASAGACIGFLWWNAAPAKIFMGDTGVVGARWHHRRALGHEPHRGAGRGAGRAVRSRGHLGGGADRCLRTTGRRVFRMAPFHHHFELAGWAETTVIIRFWLLTAIACGLGVALSTVSGSRPSVPDVSAELLPLRRGAIVLVTGARVTGRAIVHALIPLGVQVRVCDDNAGELRTFAGGGSRPCLPTRPSRGSRNTTLW